MTEFLLLLLGLGLIAACGGFVAAEFAFVTVDRPSVERAAAAGDRRSAGTLRALRTLSTQLSGAQLGITVTNLGIGYLAEPAIAQIVDGPLESAGLSAAAATGVSVTLALVLATTLTMVFGELVPKNLAIARPLETARRVNGFQRGFTTATAIPIRFLNGTANAILRKLGIEPTEELASARSPEELTALVRRSAEKGTLSTSTATLLQRSLAFGERRAVDVMTPRVRMTSLEEGAPVAQVLAAARETGHSRFPVLAVDGRDVVGVVHIRHAVAVPFDRRADVSVGAIMVRPVAVPATMELDNLLETLRAGGLQMAVVADEFGNVDGIVTFEDLVEEIVGEVVDEHDEAELIAHQSEDGSWLLSGLLRPDQASTRLGVRLPEDDHYETLGGLVTFLAGRMPDVGDAVELEVPADDGTGDTATWSVTVSSMDGHRVDEVVVRPIAATADEGGDP